MKKNQPQVFPEKIIPHLFIILAVIVAGIIAYHRSIKGVFIFDDLKLIVENPLIKDFSYLREIFSTQLFQGSGVYSNFYRPAQSLSFMVTYHFWQLNPIGYHLTNVIIHSLNSICVYFLIYIISKKQDMAFMTGLLFSVHTVLSWPVNYAASSADLLSGLFSLLAVIFYIEAIRPEKNIKRIIMIFFSLLFFILAILSKEIAVVLPFILFLYSHCFPDQNKKSRLNPIWLYFFIAAVYVSLRLTVLNFSGGKLLETTTGLIPLHLRLLTTAKVIMIYLKLLVFPTGLHMEWDIAPARSFLQDEIFLSVVGLLVIAGFIYYLYRESKLKFFAAGWFFIMLAPYFNIFPINYFMGEGWLYMPSIGFFGLIAAYLSGLKRRSRLWSWAVIGLMAFAVIFYSILTIKRADVWKDPVKLYTEVLKYSPNNTNARVNLGAELEKSGLDNKAIEKYKEAVKLNPGDAKAHINMAILYFNQQKYDEAIEEFRQAIILNSQDYVTYSDMGLCYKRKGDLRKAMEAYKKSMELNPNYPLVYNNIGNVYLEMGWYDSAITGYKKALALDPDNAAFYANLGKAYKAKGMTAESKEAFEKALKINPGNKDAADGLNPVK